MNLTLEREITSPATIGILSVDGAYECDTLELPWKDNQPGRSCIPAGRFQIIWTASPRLKRKTLRIVGVPNRTGILIHPANFAVQLLGCVALGTRRGKYELEHSRDAVTKLEKKVVPVLERGEAVYLTISDPVVA